MRAWLWFMDGAILDWVEHGDLTREQLQGLLLGTLLGAVSAAGELGRAYWTLSRSITNTSVSFGPIDGGEPSAP